jgi:RimJ/RimL family protein N-acetyltransferase
LANYNSKPILNLVLVTKRSKKIVGNFSIKKSVIGYEIGKMILNNKYLGKGIARQGSIKLLDYYFKYIKEKKILSKTKINNRANINLNTKLGFIISKKNNDYYIMELSYVRFHNFCYKKKF